MTLLSTLRMFVRTGRLLQYELAEDDDRQPHRSLYVTPDLARWINGDLARHPLSKRAVSPVEQIADFMDRFVGEPVMHINDFQQIKPAGAHVYEMKTTDVRVYGWFPAARVFIAVEGALKAETTAAGTVTAIRKRVEAFRSGLALPSPDSVRHEINVRELL